MADIDSVLVVTDAWRHGRQLNGVVVTLERVRDNLPKIGIRPRFVTPDAFTTLPLPTYPDVRISLPIGVSKLLDRELMAGFKSLHIATEGPLGWAAWSWATKKGIAFTTSFTSRFPEYIEMRVPKLLKPLLSRRTIDRVYDLLRLFHNRAQRVFVPTQSLIAELEGKGLRNLTLWRRGVDTEVFRPCPDDVPPLLAAYRGPKLLYFGRIAIEKGIEDFLKLPTPPNGVKVVIGDGPPHLMEQFRRMSPETLFLGRMIGYDLVRHVAACDVFVMPSRSETFGNVIIEALACGVPVAAYPVTGPLDIIADAPVGSLNESLSVAVAEALKVDRSLCRDYVVRNFSIDMAMREFATNLCPLYEEFRRAG